MACCTSVQLTTMIFNGEVGTVAAKRGIVKAEKTGLLSMGQITHQHRHQGTSRFRHFSCLYFKQKVKFSSGAYQDSVDLRLCHIVFVFAVLNTQGETGFSQTVLFVTIVCFYLTDKPNIICAYPGEVCPVQDGLRSATYSGDYCVSRLADPGRRPGRAGPLELHCLP